MAQKKKIKNISGISGTSISIFPSVRFLSRAGLVGQCDNCQPSIRKDEMKTKAFDMQVCLQNHMSGLGFFFTVVLFKSSSQPFPAERKTASS